jgi:hypothetical protein
MTAEGHLHELNGIQLHEKHEALTLAAATLLGQMLFEFSRLDVSLGMCLVWVDDGRELDTLNEKVSHLAFAARLGLLKAFVAERFATDSESFDAYMSWHSRADATRSMRNQLVHGRWGIDAARGQVANVVGLPTSPDQRETRYSITDLQHIVDGMSQLRDELSELRRDFPLRSSAPGRTRTA